MSSDTFRFHIDEVEGREVTLTLRPTTAAGLCDLARTRSFVLMLMAGQGLPVGLDESMDPVWLAANLDTYVTRVEGIRLVGATYEPHLRSTAADWHIPAEHLMPRLTLRATLATDALTRWLPQGLSEGTTAFDAWYDDPASGPLPREAEPAPPYDVQPDLDTRVIAALLERLPGWRSTPMEGLHRIGPDATLRASVVGAYSPAPRSRLNIAVSVQVPAFQPLLAAGTSHYIRTQLIAAELRDPLATHGSWARRYVGGKPGPELVYFADEGTQESVDSFVDRVAAAIEPPGLDALLRRDGLRGLIEAGIPRLPAPKGRPQATAIGAWPEPATPPGWRWEWSLPRPYIPDPLWARVTLHAAFGARDEARAALAQARALSKKVPAVMKPLLAELDA